MPLTESPSTIVCRRGALLAGGDPTRTVVWVRGEHDVASKGSLWWAMVDAALRDGGDVVVDLSGVQFMDASTIGALIGARNRLLAVSCALTVRAPSPWARHLLEVCGLEDLIEGHAEVGHPVGPGAALSTWVAVAPTGPPQLRQASAEPAPVAAAEAQREHAPATVSPNRAGP